LFPEWPTYDPQGALQLLVVTALVVLLPKLIGIGLEVWTSVQRKQNRWADVVTGGVVEIVMSMLLAPVMMATQIRSVAEIVLGRDSGWSAQRRDGAVTTLFDVWVFHRWHVLIGLGLAWVCWSLSWYVVAWMSPIIVGLVLSPLLSWWTARHADEGLARQLATQEDVEIPRILARVSALTSMGSTESNQKGEHC
ncbi:MAG: glucan biosynthesis glucosyltransferase H, partial [Pseudomonadota bacterium]